MIAVLAAGLTPRIAELVLLGPSPRYVDEPSTGYRGGFTRADVDQLLDALECEPAELDAALPADAAGPAPR